MLTTHLKSLLVASVPSIFCVICTYSSSTSHYGFRYFCNSIHIQPLQTVDLCCLFAKISFPLHTRFQKSLKTLKIALDSYTGQPTARIDAWFQVSYAVNYTLHNINKQRTYLATIDRSKWWRKAKQSNKRWFIVHGTIERASIKSLSLIRDNLSLYRWLYFYNSTCCDTATSALRK